MLFAKVLAVALISLCITVPAQAAQMARIAIPDDTIVSVELVQDVTSAQNHIGDTFDVRVTDPINVAGYTVVAGNAKGRGHVTKIDEAGGHGHAGMVEVVIDYVFAIDGERIRLKDVPVRQEGEKAHGGATVAGIFTYGLASNAIKGGEAVLGTSRTLTANVDGTVHVVSSVKASGPNSNANFAH